MLYMYVNFIVIYMFKVTKSLFIYFYYYLHFLSKVLLESVEECN